MLVHSDPMTSVRENVRTFDDVADALFCDTGPSSGEFFLNQPKEPLLRGRNSLYIIPKEQFRQAGNRR